MHLLPTVLNVGQATLKVPLVVIVPPCNPLPVATEVTVPVPTDTASLTQVVPFERRKLPVVLGATVCKALVPLPSNTLLAAKVEAPVPPSATAKSVIPEIEPPEIVGLVKVLFVRVAVAVLSAIVAAVTNAVVDT
jgi:hypothetical protein